MRKSFITITSLLSLFFVFQPHAQALTIEQLGSPNVEMLEAMGPHWVVGDRLEFAVALVPSKMKGTMIIAVTKKVGSLMTLTQVTSLGFLGETIADIVMDMDTGKMVSMKVNGKAQKIPANSGMKVVRQEEDKITVPAGTFECIHMWTEDGSKSSEMWVNPVDLPISGLVKSVTQISKFQMVSELTKFRRGKAN